MPTRNDGKRLLDGLAAEQDLEEVEQRIEFGGPAERLAQVAAEERAALILLGARAQRRSRRPSLRSDLSRELVRVTTSQCSSSRRQREIMQLRSRSS